jgi:hypothetical protein
MVRYLSLPLVLALASPLSAQAPPEPLVKKVKASIHKGVEFLLSQQRDDGGWNDLQGDEKSVYHGGPTGLVLLALLNCDGILDDAKLEARRQKSIERGLVNLRGIESPKVYVRALQTMALVEAAQFKTDRAQIQRNIAWLLEARVYRDNKFIGWEYENRPGIKESDASNSQYAMLALWYGRQAGIPIDRKVWVEIRDYFLRTQNANGSWIYSPDYGPNEEKGPSATMTVAGLCGLLIAGAELNGEREAWPPKDKVKNCGFYPDTDATNRAMHWITKNFNLEPDGRTFYHLYGVERAGRLSGQRFIGEHDWYREGCEFLTRSQKPVGAWQGSGRWDRWPHINTSFALLFLSKGRTPVLISKLVHGNFPRNPADTDWNSDRHDLQNLTAYLAKEHNAELFGKKPLAWQTYDVMRALYARSDKPNQADEDAVVADMRQAPVLYITGHNAPQIQPQETALIKRFVENGGFIIAEACCGDPNFDKGFKKWVKDTWDGDLTFVSPTHPVWTSFNTIKAGDPYQLMALDIGCRTIILYSPQDLSCHWESNRYGDVPSRQAFELGANMIAYATGRTMPKPRLTEIEIAGVAAPMKEKRARGMFRVMQIKHSDQWQPAPKAMSNLLENVHKVTGLDVKLQPSPLELTERNRERIQGAKFLYLHGKGEFRAKADLEPLRFTLENGGLLFADACCGDPEFDKSFRKFVQTLFPKEKLVRVPADEKDRDRLFGDKLNGEALTAANIQCRTEPNGKLKAMAPFLEGIQIDGRWVVLYSKYDIGCALERNTSANCVGYDPDSALRIATAAVRYNVRP